MDYIWLLHTYIHMYIYTYVCVCDITISEKREAIYELVGQQKSVYERVRR